MKKDDNATSPKELMLWIGRGISGLVALVFLLSAGMKLLGGESVEEMMAKLGLPDTMIMPLAVLEFTCLVIYLIPNTAVLGAILLAGYMGGAICTHWRAGDDFVVQIVIGLLVWLGVYLREPRLRALIPLRKKLRSIP